MLENGDMHQNKEVTAKHTRVTYVDLHQDSDCVVYDIIHKIRREHGWCYITCKECSSKVGMIAAKGSNSNVSKNRWPAYSCKQRGNVYQVFKRLKCVARIIDESGSAPLVVFDTNISKLCGKFIREIIDKHHDEDTEKIILIDE